MRTRTRLADDVDDAQRAALWLADSDAMARRPGGRAFVQEAALHQVKQREGIVVRVVRAEEHVSVGRGDERRDAPLSKRSPARGAARLAQQRLAGHGRRLRRLRAYLVSYDQQLVRGTGQKSARRVGNAEHSHEHRAALVHHGRR